MITVAILSTCPFKEEQINLASVEKLWKRVLLFRGKLDEYLLINISDKGYKNLYLSH